MNKPRQFTVIENQWIGLPDGTRLAARVWMPGGAEAEPVPAVLEFLPYRKRDGTCLRDESTYPVFAEAGIAGVRVDMRGCGESEGVMGDEYTAEELADAVAVIAWIAAQPWCNGSVGMMGISWGGFNALQVAALRPPALKAVISIATTVDRFNDDIHYKGGAQLSANLSWSSCMLCYSSRPPDPALVGAAWRAQWLARLEQEPLLLSTWARHQTRDAYWRHGSICEDWRAIAVPVLIVGGWADGYKNAPPAALANLAVPVKALTGPWIHKYPHFACPRPRADFHAEAIAWWKRWLAGEANGVESLPAYRAYITQAVRPAALRKFDPGRWIAEPVWPSPWIMPFRLGLSADGRLIEAAPHPVPLSKGEGTNMVGAAVLASPVLWGEGQGEGSSEARNHRSICSPQDCGTMGGEYFTLSPRGDLPADQRADDAGSLVFETGPLAEAVEILSRPSLALRVAIDAPIGNLVARLVDVHPHGTAHRVSFGVLNLAYRRDQANPQPMMPGVSEAVTVTLDECGHRFLPGHKVRLAISTAYWPLILPPPTAVTATFDLDANCALTLHTRKGGDRIDVPEPANPDPLPKYRQVTPDASRRWVTRDLASGITHYTVEVDTGDVEIAAAEGLIARETRSESYSIVPGDPLSALSQCRWTMSRRRGAWSVRTESATTLHADATHFHITASLIAYEGETVLFERDWTDKIERGFL